MRPLAATQKCRDQRRWSEAERPSALRHAPNVDLQPASAGDRIAPRGRLFLSPLPGLDRQRAHDPMAVAMGHTLSPLRGLHLAASTVANNYHHGAGQRQLAIEVYSR